MFIYENTFLHIFKCSCIVYIISIRQMKPCLGWSGVRMWIIEVSVYVTVLWVRFLFDSCPTMGLSGYVWAAWKNLHKALFHMSAAKNKGPIGDPLYISQYTACICVSAFSPVSPSPDCLTETSWRSDDQLLQPSAASLTWSVKALPLNDAFNVIRIC